MFSWDEYFQASKCIHGTNINIHKLNNTLSFPKIFGPNEDQTLDFDVVQSKFLDLTAVINTETGGAKSPHEVALGFLSVANEAMCKPIRALTESKGHSASDHHLAVFGGGGGQMGCGIGA